MAKVVRNESLAFAIIVAACVLILALPISGLMFAEYAKVHSANAAYQQNAERDREAASKGISRSCFKSDFVAFSACVNEKIAAYYKQQATNQDLQAQQDMAFWAMALFILGMGQAAISGIGIVFIWRSLALNRDAVTVAFAAIEQEQTNAERQLRAYMYVDKCTLTVTSDSTIRQFVTIRNFGQTPAYRYSANVWFKVCNDKTTPDYKPFERVPSTRSVAPSAAIEFDLSFDIIKNTEADNVLKEIADLYVWGTIFYADAFDKDRETNFTMKYYPRKNKEAGVFRAITTGNEAT